MTIRTVFLVVALALAVLGCGSSAPSPAASQASVPTVAPTASTVPTAAQTTAPAPTPSPNATPGQTACPVEAQTGRLPSDRLTDIEVLGPPGRDIVRFVFGEDSIDSVGPSTGTLEVAVPPFTGGSSGLPLEVKGEHVLQVVFKGMSLQNDVGQPVYDGPRDFEVADRSRSLRHVVLFDEFEGQSGWYVGYDGPGCVTLAREGDAVVLAIESGPGS